MIQNPHRDKQVSGFYHTLCPDWKNRIIKELEIIFTLSDKEEFSMKKLLAISLLENYAMDLRNNIDE